MTKVRGRVLLLATRRVARELFPLTYDAWWSGDLTIRVIDMTIAQRLGHGIAQQERKLSNPRKSRSAKLHIAVVKPQNVLIGRTNDERPIGNAGLAAANEVDAEPLIADHINLARGDSGSLDDQASVAQVLDALSDGRVWLGVEGERHSKTRKAALLHSSRGRVAAYDVINLAYSAHFARVGLSRP